MTKNSFLKDILKEISQYNFTVQVHFAGHTVSLCNMVVHIWTGQYKIITLPTVK